MRLAVFLATLAVPSACTDRPVFVSAETSRASVRDSLGVRIVENSEPEWGDGDGWRVDPEPLLQIGEVDGEDPYLFQGISWATRLPAGGVALLESATLQIRVFDPAGSYLRSIGRRGEGPGEWVGRPVIVLAPPDTLVVFDLGLSRMSRFLLDGTLLSETGVQMPGGRPRSPSGWAVRPDGTVVGEYGVNARQVIEGNTATVEQDVDLVVIPTGDRPVVSLGVYPATRTISYRGPTGEQGGARNPFVFNPPVAVGRNDAWIHVVPDGDWEVRTFGRDGALLRIVRIGFPRRAVAESMAEAIRDEIAATVPPARQAITRQAFDLLTLPDSTPGIGRLESDGHGALFARHWVYPANESAPYEVIDPEGHWLGSMEIPLELGSVLEIGADYVLTEWRNELDVAFLRVYPLLRSR